MFNRNIRLECKDFTVGELVDYLMRLKQDTKVLFNGDNYGFIHVEDDYSCISFDDASLDDLYDNQVDEEESKDGKCEEMR